MGDRVIVMSSTGSRAGMLRYIGETDFAKGVWCGVECDDPVGKNDGAVQGVRSVVTSKYLNNKPIKYYNRVYSSQIAQYMFKTITTLNNIIL